MDDEAVSALHVPPPQGESQASLEFQVSSVPQSSFFPPMTPKSCMVYVNFQYAQAQVRALAKKGQYLVPSTTTLAQPSRFGL